MQIDPRVLKQMIQMQVMNNIDLSGTALESTTVQSSGSDTFESLLEQFLWNSVDNKSTTASTSSNLDLNMLASLYPSLVDSPYFNEDNVNAFASYENQQTIPTQYDDIIKQASQKYGISEALIKAVIKVESSFNPETVSSAGAKGLMQLMDATARGLGVTNSFDPAQNIDGGTKYLSYQLKRFDGQEKLALAAYNGGPNRLAKLGIQTEQELMEKLHLLPKETQNYLRKIDHALQSVTV
ncbi:lytic transglycosylase [Paenibacillus selenitireducens]|uniref:Lytic transglycosylase n=1 Tax=Paenibacillus selenitireducens TaxID=1324314 RepID=A0A1T2XF49_9BACL|nr:lytic transglycosylase domain-containing protein [Paenibacillus selenitireducens]OPA78432.1 lytic transglycosylase [Paenibacillus selenitireducens]